MILFMWKADGSWRYEANKNIKELSILVPLDDGQLTPIKHLLVTIPTKMLGQLTFPTGSSNGAITQMKEKA
jgi:hypothetical protein